MSPVDLPATITPMLRMLSFEAKEEVLLALNATLNAGPSSAERRVAELGPLARLLDEKPQEPDRLPYVQRQQYDRRYANRASPRSAYLAARYGSWRHACCAAWTLLPDGRKPLGAQPWPRVLKGTPKPPPYTAEECKASVRLCAEEIGHIPSSAEYQRWVIARAAEVPADRRLVHYRTVLRVLAPNRDRRNGWTIVITAVFGD